jgi:hypothetical protein
MAQITSGVSESRPYDVMGTSVQATSARFGDNRDALKLNSDILVFQGAYQFLLDAFYFDPKGGTHLIDTVNPAANNLAPPPGLVTYQTLILAAVDQEGFIPYFEKQNTNLFTPQIQYSISNIPLAGVGDSNRCAGAPKGSVPGQAENYCVSVKLTANFGDTFNTMKPVQDNVNYALLATPTIRFNETNFVISFPNSYGEKIYNNLAGGRHDFLWQHGVTPQYSFDIPDNRGKVSASISIPVNYTQYHSSIVKNSYNDLTVMPTLKFSVAPKLID